MAGRIRGEVGGQQVRGRPVDGREREAPAASGGPLARGRARRRARGARDRPPAATSARPSVSGPGDPVSRAARAARPGTARSTGTCELEQVGDHAAVALDVDEARQRHAVASTSVRRSGRSRSRRWARRAFSPPGALVDCRTHDAPRVARGRPRRGRHGPDLRQPARRSRHPVLLRARLHPRRPRLRARRGRARRGRRWSCSGRWGSACPRCWSRTCAPRWRVAAARFYGDPTATLRVAGITGTNGKTTTAFLTRALLEGAGLPTGLLGTVKSVVGGRRARGRAHDAGGDRPPAHVPRDARRRATSRARWRSPRTRWSCKRADGDPRRRGGLHQPHAGPPRLPSDDGGLLPGQAAAVRLAADARRGSSNADDAYGRRLIEEFDCADASRSTREADYRAVDVRTDATGCDFVAVTPDGVVRGAGAAARALQRAQRAGARGRRRGRWARRPTGSPRRWRAAATAPGPLPAGRGGPAVRRRRRLRAQARRAGAGAAGGARAGVGAADRGRRRGRGPRPRQAADDGRDRRAAGRRGADHLRQPALRGAGGDHRRDRRRDSGVAARVGRARRRPPGVDLPRDRARPRPATSS